MPPKNEPKTQAIEAAYQLAKERYAEMNVNTDGVLRVLETVPISLHCWQGDDVRGFEGGSDSLGDGLAVTGNYMGKARNADELRRDLDMAYSLIPGKHRLNLHAIYAETGKQKVERTDLQPEHFSRWVDWAKENEHGIDFNPTCFSHPKSSDGFTLSHPDNAVRQFWIEHCIVCRHIGAYFGKELGTPTITNIWIPDGYKDTPANRLAPRERLKDSLDKILATPLNKDHHLDAIECKLFGIGSESYVVGSHEFYMGYAVKNQTLLTLDAGHFHPTEGIADKISSMLLYVPELLLHVSRGVRWDSDHVVTFNDDLQATMQEIVRGEFLSQVHIGLDYFDASINRVAAWAIGTRNTIKALLMALLEPRQLLQQYEKDGKLSARLMLLEDLKSMPYGAVWDYYCHTKGVPVGMDVWHKVQQYETKELSKRQ
jgi:L-rhamnose isomerase